MKHSVPTRILVTAFVFLFLVVTANSVRALDSNGADTSICLGNPVKLTASLPSAGTPGYYYTWSAKLNGSAATDAQAGWQGSPTLSVQSPASRVAWSAVTKQVTVKPTAVGTYTYKFEISDLYGCTSFQEVTVYVKDTVKLSIANETQSICAGSAITNIGIDYSNATLSISPAAGTGLTFTPGTGGTGNFSGSLSGSPAAPGTYTITASSTESPIPVCSSKEVTVSLTVYDPISDVSISGAGHFCEGTTTTLTASASNGSGSYAYLWERSANGSTWTVISGATASTYAADISSDGTTYYRVTVSENGGVTGCSPVTSDAVQVIVHDAISAGTITGSFTRCYDQSATTTLTANPSGGSGDYEYQWQRYSSSTWVDIDGETGSTYAAPTGTTTGSTQYRVIVRDHTATGCAEQTSAAVTVTVYEMLIPTLSASPSEICSGQSVALSVTSIAGGSGTASSYEWSTTTAGNDTPVAGSPASSATARPLKTGTVRYKVKVTDDAGCVGNKTVDVTVNKSPILSLSSDEIVCYGDPGMLVMVVTPGIPSYTFSKDNGVNWDALTDVGANNYQYTDLSAGPYTVIVKDSKGCTDTASRTITQKPEIVINSTDKTQPTCHGGSNGSITVVVTGGTANSTSPYYGTVTLDGNTPSSASASGSLYTYTFTGLSAADDHTLYIKDRLNCEKTFTIDIGEPTAVVPAAITASATTICFGQSVTLSAQAATGGTPGADPAYTYVWTASNGDSPTTATPTTPNVTAATFTPTTTGTVTFTLTATDGATPTGCPGTKTIDVTVNPLPSVSITPNTAQYKCKGEAISELTVEGANGTTTVTGLPAGVTYNSSTGKISGTPTTSGEYTITATTTSTFDCTPSAVEAVKIYVYEEFTVTESMDDADYCKDGAASALTLAVTGSGSYSYQWYANGDAIAAPRGTAATLTPGTANYDTDTTYSVKVTDATCTQNSTIEVASVHVWPVLEADVTSITAEAVACVNDTTAAVSDTNGLAALGFHFSQGHNINPAVTVVSNSFSGENCNGGRTTVYRVTDECGNTVDVSYIQPVKDTIAPEVAIIAETQNAQPAGNCQYKIPDVTALVRQHVGTSDNCIAREQLIITQVPAADTPYDQTDENQTIPVSVTVEDLCHNSNMTTVNVLVPARNLTLSVTDTAYVCAGDSVRLSADGSDNDGVTYEWSPATGLNTIAGNIVMASPSENTVYTVTVTDQNGCTRDTEVVVIVYPTLELTVDNTDNLVQAVCLGGDLADVTVTFDNAEVDVIGLPTGVTYNTTSHIIGGQPQTSGEYGYMIIATHINGCGADTLHGTITVHDTTVLTATNLMQTICLGSAIDAVPVEYSGATLSVSALPAGLAVTSHGDGRDTIYGIPAAVQTATEYTITATNANCGGKELTITLTVNDTAKLSATNLMQTICLGSAIDAVPIEYSGATLSVSALPAGLTITSHGDGRDTIYGTPAAMQTATTYAITVVNANCGNKELTFTLAVGTSYVHDTAVTMCEGGAYDFYGTSITTEGTFTQTFPSTYGCDSVFTLTMTLEPAVRSTIEMIPDCEMSQYIIVGTTDGDSFEWSSSVDDGQIDAQRTSDTIRVSPSETTTYTLTADREGVLYCTATETITVNEFMVPNARIDTHDMNLSPDFTQWTAENASDNGVVGYEWYVNGQFYSEQGESIRGEIDPATNDAEISLMLVAFSQYCSDTAYAQIPIVTEPIYVPNIFTPAARTNRLFGIEGTGIVEYELWIYSREGLLVFHTTSLDEKWDGTHQGKGTVCKQEAYTYKIHYRIAGQDTMRQKFGTVTLVR